MTTRLRTRVPLRALWGRGRRPPPAATARRRARRAVLCGLVALLAAMVGMAVAVESVRTHWRDPEYGHRLRQIRHWKQTRPDRPLVVAVGTSRTQMGLSPAHMGFADAPGSPVVYNFGQAGAGPLQLLLTVRRLLDDGPAPDFLLVELFPAALAQDGPAEVQFQFWQSRLGAADVRRLEPYCDDPAALRRAWAAGRANSWHTHRQVLLSHWQPGWLPWPKRLDFQWTRLDPHGWMPYPFEALPEAERRKGTGKARDLYVAALTDYRIGASSERAVREIVSRCRGAGIPVAFYLTPEGPSFAGWYAPETRAKFAAFCGVLTRDLGVSVFDAAGGFADAEFADSHHLLRSGAVRFSRTFAAEHLAPWVAAAR